jgi:hypothetical protein
MLSDWNLLSDELQLVLSKEALRRAAATIAVQADLLAGEIEAGTLLDRGGADALRLFAELLRTLGQETPVGQA